MEIINSTYLRGWGWRLNKIMHVEFLVQNQCSVKLGNCGYLHFSALVFQWWPGLQRTTCYLRPPSFSICKMGPWTTWPQGSSTCDILWHSSHLWDVPLPSCKSSQSSELESLAVCCHAAWKPHLLERVPLAVTVSKTGLGSNCKWCTYTWQGASESGRHVLLCGYLTPSSDLAHAPALSGHKKSINGRRGLFASFLPS